MADASRQEVKFVPAPTRVRTVAEGDAWQARQLLASKRNSTGSSASSHCYNTVLGGCNRVPAAGGEQESKQVSSTIPVRFNA